MSITTDIDKAIDTCRPLHFTPSAVVRTAPKGTRDARTLIVSVNSYNMIYIAAPTDAGKVRKFGLPCVTWAGASDLRSAAAIMAARDFLWVVGIDLAAMEALAGWGEVERAARAFGRIRRIGRDRFNRCRFRWQLIEATFGGGRDHA